MGRPFLERRSTDSHIDREASGDRCAESVDRKGVQPVAHRLVEEYEVRVGEG